MNMKLSDTSPTPLQHLYSAVYIIYREKKGFRFGLFGGNIRGEWCVGWGEVRCLLSAPRLPLTPQKSR